ncbi:Rv2253/PknI dimerization domain-containing protein [Mycolicibacterium thermoresistibile]
MSVSRTRTGAAIIAATAIVGLTFAAPADANPEWGINGTFAVSSNGDLARVNERYQDQPGERATWTIHTECIGPIECAGTVTSDQGWSAPIYTTNGLWFVKRVVPEWRFCADGQAVEGLRTYKIYPVGFDGHYDAAADEYAGENQTVGASGSCGRNQWPQIRMPFYMKKL